VLDTLSKLTITDPTDINVPVTYFISEETAKKQGIYGWTVAKLFTEGFPDHAPGEKLVGWSPSDSNVIFILPAYMSPQLLGHDMGCTPFLGQKNGFFKVDRCPRFLIHSY
jgi:hypothetical protein